VVAALAGGVALVLNQSNPVAARIDSAAVTIASSTTTIDVTTTTTTTPVAPGEVQFLSTRSSIVGSDYWVDLAGMSEGTCFVIVKYSQPDPVAEPTDCGIEHYYQVFAIGVLPPEITEYAQVDGWWSQFCDDEFTAFVGIDDVDSRFGQVGLLPASFEFPGFRTVTCYLYVPGEFGWIGSAEGSNR
jgi:hypothetical protein